MKNFLNIIILPIAIMTMLVGFVPEAFASVPPLDVQFVPSPLFHKPNFLPGDETSGEVTVTNNSGSSQIVSTEAINIFDDDNFGSLLHLDIVGSDGVVFNDSLAHFFAHSGELSLGALPSGQSAVFTFTISFVDSSDNSYQGKALGFDVCVGFQGGNTHCGSTVVGDERGTSGGGVIGGSSSGGIIPGSGSGGGSVMPIALAIFNERVIDISSEGEFSRATIAWETNKLATSQVVYGLASGGPYTFDLGVPNFGYPFATLEDSMKVTHHSVLLTGLIPGQVYVYRVASRASPPTVSFEHQFTVPMIARVDDLTVVGESSSYENGGGSVLGNSTINVPENASGQDQGREIVTPVVDSSNSNSLNNVLSSHNNLAAVYASSSENVLSLCTLFALLILFVIYVAWRWLRMKYEKNMIPEKEIRNRFFVFFGGSSVFVATLSVVFGQYCLLPVFLSSSLICLVVYMYRRFFAEK